MLLLTIVYDEEKEYIIEHIRQMVGCFRGKNIDIGISESLIGNTHFVKIYCSEENCDKKFLDNFKINMANILYKVAIDEFYKKGISDFLYDTYFFLKQDELSEIKSLSLKALKSEGALLNENSVYIMNRKNAALEKIVDCIEENNEINIKGFITFRMKEIRNEIESIIDRVVEEYMVEKEYSEFIKLLKYFVDIAESKIDEVNIIIDEDNNYKILNKIGVDIMKAFFSDIGDDKVSNAVSVDDMIISGLITNAPGKINIYGADNCKNKELIDTIKNVFTDRVFFFSKCRLFNKTKNNIKV